MNIYYDYISYNLSCFYKKVGIKSKTNINKIYKTNYKDKKKDEKNLNLIYLFFTYLYIYYNIICLF